MHIERMHKMIECLTEKALNELEKGVENVDTHEMGAVIDMIKDLNEAEYRAVITKEMKEADEEEEEYNKELLEYLRQNMVKKVADAITTATDTLTADLPQRVEGQEPQADEVMTNHLIGT